MRVGGVRRPCTCLLHHTMNVKGRRRTRAWKFVRPLRGRCCCQWRAWTRCYCRRSDWIVILATGWSRNGHDILLGINLCGGNSFTISVLVRGVESRNSEICWRERGFRGQGIGDFELAGDLKGLSFSCSVLLLKLFLLLPFEMF